MDITTLLLTDYLQLHSVESLKTLIGESFIGLSTQWSETQLSSELAQAQGVVALSSSKQPMAVILYRVLPGEVLEVSWLCTGVHYRKNGVMAQLFDYLRGQFPKKEIWLEVSEKNSKALGFYKKMGFNRGGRRPNYYGPNEAAILMTFAPKI